MKSTITETSCARETIFGELPQVVDYVYSIASLVPMMMHDIEGPAAVQFQAARFAELHQAAVSNLDAVPAEFTATPSGSATEVDRLRRGMLVLNEACHIAYPGRDPDKTSDRKKRDLLFGLLDAEAVDIGTELRMYAKARAQELQGFDSGSRAKFREADSLVNDATREDGTERSALLRQARKIYLELTKEAGASSSPILWSCCAWMTWQHTGNINDALAIIEGDFVHTQMSAKVGYSMLVRIYAYFLNKTGRAAEAYQWACTAAKVSPSGGTLHERASYAVAGEADERLKPDIEAFLKRSRLAIPLAFADPRLAGLKTTLLDLAVAEQRRITRLTGTAISRWNELAHRVQEAQTVAGQFPVPRDLLEGAKIAAEGANGVDFMTASELLLTAGESFSSLKHVAQSSLESERLRAADQRDQARKGIDGVIQQRDEYVNHASETQRDAVLQSRRTLSDADETTERVQRKFAWGMGSGCAVFGIYILSAGALSMKGMQTGINSPMGIAAAVLTGIPVAYALINYLTHSAKRMKMEEEIRREIATRSRAHETAVREADDKVRAQLSYLRKQLEECEQHLTQVESAQKLLL